MKYFHIRAKGENQTEKVSYQHETLEILKMPQPEDVRFPAMFLTQEQKEAGRLHSNRAGKVDYYQLSYDEKLIVAKAVYAEAKDKPLEKKVAVASIVLQRYFSKVVNENYNGNLFVNLNKKVKLDEILQNPEYLEAVDLACKGWAPTRAKLEEGAYFFYDPNGIGAQAAKERAKLKAEDKYQIDGHIFHAYL